MIPEQNAVCQIVEQEAYSVARRPALIYGQSGILRRFRGPLRVLSAVRRSLRDRGLPATLKKSAVASVAKVRARFAAKPRPEQHRVVGDLDVLNLRPGEPQFA